MIFKNDVKSMRMRKRVPVPGHCPSLNDVFESTPPTLCINSPYSISSLCCTFHVDV